MALSAFTSLFGRRHIGHCWDRFNCLWCFPFVWFTMGRKFGSLTKGKNIVTYSLSPFEQRAFAGVTKSIANMARRVRTQLPYQLPAFISGILLYTWAMEDFRQRNRKNPKDYANDEWIFLLIAMWISTEHFLRDAMGTSKWCYIMMLGLLQFYFLVPQDDLNLKLKVFLTWCCIWISVINFSAMCFVSVA